MPTVAKIENQYWELLQTVILEHGYYQATQLLARLLLRLSKNQESQDNERQSTGTGIDATPNVTTKSRRRQGALSPGEREIWGFTSDSDDSPVPSARRTQTDLRASKPDRRSKVKKKAQFADNDEVFILGEFQGPVASNQSSPSKTLTTKPTTSILKNSPLRKGNAQDGSPGSKWATITRHTAELPADNAWAKRCQGVPAEHVRGWEYDPTSKEWTETEMMVKIERQEFARGAMRKCFAMKWLQTFNKGWEGADNYVAKRYIEAVDRQVYFDDVKLQMSAKLYGAKFNAMNPPKKVDVVKAFLVEFTERKDGEVFCVEHLIDGDYRKYNSNSGFVEDDTSMRSTPQAFSHFTYETSKCQEIVVDVQGVGNLYTDPQIHSVNRDDYGEGNLGARGIALFFSTHVCSPLCTRLGLKPFPMCKREIARMTEDGVEADAPPALEASGGASTTHGASRRAGSLAAESAKEWHEECLKAELQCGPDADNRDLLRSLSAPVPSTVHMSSVLHYHIAYLYGDAQRNGKKVYGRHMGDAWSGIYHLRRAALGGVQIAALQLWRIHSQMRLNCPAIAALVLASNTLFTKMRIGDETRLELAVAYLTLAARSGNAAAAAKLGTKYQMGDNVTKNMKEAFSWYEYALKKTDELAKNGAQKLDLDSGVTTDEEAPDLPPSYQLRAHLGEILEVGGNGLKSSLVLAANRYDEAAKEAAAAGKDKMAAKWKEKADELRNRH